MIQFEITGDARPKKNSRVNFRAKNGASLSIPSKQYTKWSKVAKMTLKTLSEWSYGFPVVVELYHYRQTNRKFDFSNMFEGIQDELQKHDIIPDDDMQHVIPMVDLFTGTGLGWEKDKDNPRMLVTITELKEWKEKRLKK